MRGPDHASSMSDSVWKPDVTVAAIVERDGHFLFVEERVRGELVLNQPAGHLESGESLLAATIRETLEETGWQVEPTGLVGLYQWTSPRDGMTFLRVAVAARPLAHDATRSLDDGIERAVWLAPDALDSHPVPRRSPLVGHCLRDYLARGCAPLDRLGLIDVHGLRIA
jgi:8-oxo-dGTP pyrophosphatase MutT (NUDIX family)